MGYVEQLTNYLSHISRGVNNSLPLMDISHPYFMVPQGSNLGPILFSVYFNDMFNNFDTPPVLYTDDTCLNISAQTKRNYKHCLIMTVTKHIIG